jgi:hypothetical protein
MPSLFTPPISRAASGRLGEGRELRAERRQHHEPAGFRHVRSAAHHLLRATPVIHRHEAQARPLRVRGDGLDARHAHFVEGRAAGGDALDREPGRREAISDFLGGGVECR